MKKPISILFMIIVLTGCANLPPTTPFFGGFMDTTPDDLAAIHTDIMDRMVPIPGTERWEYMVLPNGGIAGRISDNGLDGWCSNYIVAIEQELSKAGYSCDQMTRAFCSVYDTEKPDHVVLILDHPDGHKYIFDSRYAYVQGPGDYPKNLTLAGIDERHVPYIWWARADGKWIQAKL